jgi:hypothetical protein
MFRLFYSHPQVDKQYTKAACVCIYIYIYMYLNLWSYVSVDFSSMHVLVTYIVLYVGFEKISFSNFCTKKLKNTKRKNVKKFKYLP